MQNLAAIKSFGMMLVLLNLAVSMDAQTSNGEPESAAVEHANHHGKHQNQMAGMVMNANSETLPDDCSDISREHRFLVEAGVEFATPYAANVFGMSQHEWRVEPCSRITVVFRNNDEIRHQWMVHGLPRYLYDQGMFHIEVAGGQSLEGTFIVPGDDRTYLVHCDVAQHMEKGMKGQLIVGAGSGDLWSIPGITATFRKDAVRQNPAFLILILSAGMAIALVLAVWSQKRHGH
tara:strand:- start:383 stop:1081 length:699 start_codon:yes stop_codon:yes gene_type:complete